MEKIKQFIDSEKGKDLLTILIVILVGLASFGLGRMSTKENSSPGVKITYPAGPANAISALDSTSPYIKNEKTSQNTISSGNYFASIRGKKYYSLDCSGGGTIKDTNKVWFKTEEEAQKAGYEISSTC